MIPTAVAVLGPSDITCDVESATVRHGRDDPTSQPEASTATLNLVGVVPVEIGQWVSLVAVHASISHTRFLGKVTDVEIGWEDVDHPFTRLTAAGDLATMGRRVIGDAPFPAELDGARANRAITASGVATDAARTDPGTVQVLARDVDAQPALNVAQDAAQDGMGILWQTRDGYVVYADADHRRGSITPVALDACEIPVGVVWSRTLEGLVNDVRVRYGMPEAEVRATDASSITDLGTYGYSLTTRLASSADATSRANGMLARQARPAWVLTGISVDLGLLTAVNSTADDTALTAQLLALDVHGLLSVTGLPAGSPYTSAVLWVEGWTEQVAWGEWSIAYAVSDYCRTSPEPRWDDLPDAYTWDTVPDKTWDQTTCLPPIPPSGTWDDIPATTRWDQVDAATTWDTWS